MAGGLPPLEAKPEVTTVPASSQVLAPPVGLESKGGLINNKKIES